MNNKLINLIALGEDLAKRTSEAYAEIAAELADIKYAALERPAPEPSCLVPDNFPVKGKLREQVLYVLDQSQTGLATAEIVELLKDKSYKYGIDIALPKLRSTLDAMEKRNKDIQVERLPNGRKVHYLSRAC